MLRFSREHLQDVSRTPRLSDRWLRLLNLGACPRRLLWASTSTRDPQASNVLYVKSLAAPHAVNTIPEKALLAFADHGEIGPMMSPDGGDGERVLGEITRAGIDLDALATQLQREGNEAFVKSWDELLECIVVKSTMLEAARRTGPANRKQ